MQIKNVLWMFELDGRTSFECMLAWPEGTKLDEYIVKMREAASKVFARVHEFPYPEAIETTWPAGANWAWQSVARWVPMITNYKGNPYPFEKVLPDGTPWLFLEADAVPLKRDWMQTLFDEYKRGGKPFMGHIVKDMGHMNGVAVYPNDVAKYARDAFHVVHSAWDVALREQTIDLTHNANHLIQHCWGLASNDKPQHRGDDPVASFRDVGHMMRVLNAARDDWEVEGCHGLEPKPVLFHRTKDGSLIDCLMEALGNNPQPPNPNTDEVSAVSIITKGASEFPEQMGETHLSPDDMDDPPRKTVTVKEIPPDETGAVGVTEITYDKRDFPNGFPKTDIFIVTFGGDCGFRTDPTGQQIDCQWLKYCLYSIKKFCTGFRNVIVMVPDRDIETVEPVCREWGPENLSIEMFTEVEGKGMLHHMAIECMADQYCQSDFVLHFDSDCIFIEPVTPADYFGDEGKPVLLMEAYERFKVKHPGVLRWQEATEKAIGKPVGFEFMRRHPAVHYREIYPKTREMVETAHNMLFLDWAVSGKNEFPQSWSEYNLLGAVAWIRKRRSYHWINTGNDLPPKSKLWQGWSHGGLDRPTDTGAFVPETPRQIFKKVLGI